MSDETPLRVLVVDDEDLARRRLTRLLSSISGVVIAGECRNGEDLLTTLEEEPVDVVLLDIQMPGLTGIEVSQLVDERETAVIFVTAYPEHALSAFDVGAEDYVLKPVEPGRLQKALGRARSKVSAGCGSIEPQVDRLAVVVNGAVRLIDPETLSHAEFDGALVTLHLLEETLLSDFSLAELERRLPKGKFERVHRRALLNLEKVRELQPLSSGGYIARTENGKTVPVSRKAARRLRKNFGLA